MLLASMDYNMPQLADISDAEEMVGDYTVIGIYSRCYTSIIFAVCVN